jgi:Collagen triple helix repeat (20 copies)
MKNLKISIYFLLIVFSCKGPNGETGPAGQKGDAGLNGKDGLPGTVGAVGATGATGAAGKDGKDASLNAKATPWFRINYTEAFMTNLSTQKNNNGVSTTTAQFNLKDNSFPFLTKEVVDNGVILIYYKFNDLGPLVDGGQPELAERILGGAMGPINNIRNNFKIEGRNTNNYSDYSNIQFFCYNYGVNYWNPYSSFSTDASELVGQPISFYRELFNKNAPQIRLVTIPLPAGGRRPAIDYSDYPAVKKAFNLKD